MSTLAEQVAAANARIGARHDAGAKIHGGFYIAGDDEDPHALVTCGMHCEVCEMHVGGAFDLELEPSVEHVERQLLRQLAERGCPHAHELVEREGLAS